MATFRHKRYPELILMGERGIRARFYDGELETTDAALVKSLRASKDPDLVEVKAASKDAGEAKQDAAADKQDSKTEK